MNLGARARLHLGHIELAGQRVSQLHCKDCSGLETSSQRAISMFVPRASLSVGNQRYRTLLLECLTKIPKNGKPIQLRTSVRLRKKGSLPGVVGLTTFLVEGYSGTRPRGTNSGRHTVTFYTELMNQLTDRAVVAVMAHELAHAWLNEHIRPEASQQREEDADLLAEMWGFAQELSALASETDPMS